MSSNQKPIVVSILNAKGGVGKTTVTLNLGASLASKGYKVLVVDTDLQANLTQSLIGAISQEQTSLADCLINEQGLDSAIVGTDRKNLYLLPVNDLMVEVDLNLASKIGRERILKNCLEATKQFNSFDFVLIDNPPYMSLITVNNLTASDYYLIPVSSAYLSLMGIKLLEKNIQKLKAGLKLDLNCLGLLITMYDLRERVTKQAEEALRETFADKVFKTVIRVNTNFKTAPISKQTIQELEKQAGVGKKGTEDFENLAEEFLGHLQVHKSIQRAVNERF